MRCNAHNNSQHHAQKRQQQEQIKDTTKSKELAEVVVTATRSEKMLSAIPMPVVLISQKQIQQMGSLRLNEVLQEQTGLAIQANHGNGIQMQGMNPDYTLILIDGEPLIGRTAGTLELSRLAVGNIKQIEIIKGASSSLYGSEALAGVVNIITENPKKTSISLSSRYGTNNTLDFGLNAALKYKKLHGNIFVNRYATNGYDFTPATFGQTVEPFHSYTIQGKLSYEFTKTLKLAISARYFIENQQNNYDVGTLQNPAFVSGNGQVKDFNLNPVLHYNITKKLKTQFRFYNSIYETNSRDNYLKNNEIFDESFFRQTFLRPELQAEYIASEKHIFIFGGGNIWETVAATRYEGIKTFTTNYIFGQYEWLPTEKWNVIFGGRLDNHTVYGSQFSPKLSLQYELTKKIALRGSIGAGFKAPDFRQLYLNFSNAVAGYSVFGTEELPAALAKLQAQNQITEILLNPSEIGKLQAESSIAYNFGAKITPIDNIIISLNFFRNDISNLIETQAFARKTNGQNIFSYRNLNQVFTQGLEFDISYKINKKLTLSAGYQYLQAKDKKIVEQLHRGEIFRRNPITFVTTRLTEADYGGLFGRSANTLNAKVFYENSAKGISATLRGFYRGRYGLGDSNGNLILDEDSEYISGYFTCNISASKEFFKQKLRLQAGIDNVFDQKDTQNIPNLAGRLLWIGANFKVL
jgi:outer membrane receptor for ferrienterochelin and colicins